MPLNTCCGSGSSVKDDNALIMGNIALCGMGDLEGVKVRLTFEGYLPPFGITFAYEGTSVSPAG